MTASGGVVLGPMPFWPVARTAPQREPFAVERLEAGGFEIFAPKIRAKRQIVPLFPAYLFVRIASAWQPVDRTPGVIGLIRFGDEPAKCPDAEIDRIRSHMDADGVVRLPAPPRKPQQAKPAFQPGAKIVITGGPLQGRLAIYAGMTVGQRETVLLTMLGRQTGVAVAAGLIAAR
jgi:transcriptional antiterminator RfaH